MTGKYNDGNRPADSRAKHESYTWLEGTIKAWDEDGKLSKVKELSEYAKTHFDCSVTELALAWCVKNPNVTTVLLGATKEQQIESNLQAIDIVEKLTDEHMESIEKILGNKPADYWGHGNRKIPTI